MRHATAHGTGAGATFVSGSDISIRAAVETDAALILDFIRRLAEYERLTHEVVATEERLRRDLFGPKPAAEVLIADVGGEPAGFALFFQNYSTFLAQPGIYLEDLFVLPEQRKLGIGRRLLGHIAALALDRGCGRFEWSVLDWNAPSIRFYESLGAKALREWHIYRLTGDTLRRLGQL